MLKIRFPILYGYDVFIQTGKKGILLKRGKEGVNENRDEYLAVKNKSKCWHAFFNHLILIILK
jgi:hypothetical protein